EHVEFARDAVEFVLRQDADALQPLGVCAAGPDVVQEELAVEHHVVAGQEGLDGGVDGDAGLLPEEIGHVVFLRWVAAAAAPNAGAAIAATSVLPGSGSQL